MPWGIERLPYGGIAPNAPAPKPAPRFEIGLGLLVALAALVSFWRK